MLRYASGHPPTALGGWSRSVSVLLHWHGPLFYSVVLCNITISVLFIKDLMTNYPLFYTHGMAGCTWCSSIMREACGGEWKMGETRERQTILKVEKPAPVRN